MFVLSLPPSLSLSISYYFRLEFFARLSNFRYCGDKAQDSIAMARWTVNG